MLPLRRPLLLEVICSRPFAEFSPSDAEAEDGKAIYRLIVSAVSRRLADVDSATSAREAAHIIVAAHRGFVMTELGGLAGSSLRSVESRYRLGVDALLGGLARGVDASSSMARKELESR